MEGWWLTILAAGPPGLVCLVVVVLLAVYYKPIRRGLALAKMHGELLSNMRMAVEEAGRDGLGPDAIELWKKEAGPVLEWLRELLQDAAEVEKPLEEIEVFVRSRGWETFWEDLEAAVDYAWIVGLRHDLEAWAEEAIARCPRTVKAGPRGEETLREQFTREVHHKLAKLYAYFNEERDAEEYLKPVAEELREVLEQIPSRVENIEDAAVRACAKAWAEHATKTLREVLGEHAVSGGDEREDGMVG